MSYEIKTIAVPMFVNRSVIPELAAPMTKEITTALISYTGINVLNGDDLRADALLIGIIESSDHQNEVIQTTSSLFTDDTLKSSVGERSPFYYPVQTTYNFTLRIILIKKPSPGELQLLTGDLGKYLKENSKIILTETLPLTGTFSRVVGGNSSTNSSGVTNFVKNKGLFEKSIQDTAVNAAKTFEQVVLNAF